MPLESIFHTSSLVPVTDEENSVIRLESIFIINHGTFWAALVHCYIGKLANIVSESDQGLASATVGTPGGLLTC